MMVAYYSCQIPIPFFGAGDGARTHDLDLGKVALYQLSYARKKEEQNCFHLERAMGLEPTTSTLARSRSTN